MKKYLPNLITLMNLFCGCVATVFAAAGQFETATVLVCMGIAFDFFDGLAARALKVKSELGLQLDSLADMVTSGLVPGIVMFRLLGGTWSGPGAEFYTETDTMHWIGIKIAPLALVGFLITLASAYRLARFNIDARQTNSFIGLPTPANALWIMSLPLITKYQAHIVPVEVILNPWVLVVITLCSAFLLNSEIELFALKSNNTKIFPYGFIALALILLFSLHFLAVPIIIALYIVSSMIMKISTK